MNQRSEATSTDDRDGGERKRAGVRSSVGVSEANAQRVRVSASIPTPDATPLRSRGGVRTHAGDAHDALARTTRTRVGSSIDLDGVLDQALKLNRDDAKRLLDQLALRMQTTDKAMHNRDLEAWCQCVHTELSEVLGASDSYGIMQVRKAMSEPECWRPVEKFMQAAGLDGRTSAERRAMYMLLAELLIEHTRYETRRMKFGLVLNSVARYVVDLIAIFDDAFPGYLRSGLAFMVAQQQQKIATGATSV